MDGLAVEHPDEPHAVEQQHGERLCPTVVRGTVTYRWQLQAHADHATGTSRTVRVTVR